MTSQKIAISLVAVALFVGSMTARAADFDAGMSAYDRGDYAMAIRIFRQFADQGYASAQYNLGVMYERGQGVTQDYDAAVRWYRKAAEQGNAKAQTNLGVMYHNGWGVPQDYTEALRWFRKAAAQGHAGAQYNLGQMYRRGQGVKQDYVRAYVWWELAVAKGKEQARKGRDIVAKLMTAKQIAEAQKLAREWKPQKGPK